MPLDKYCSELAILKSTAPTAGKVSQKQRKKLEAARVLRLTSKEKDTWFRVFEDSDYIDVDVLGLEKRLKKIEKLEQSARETFLIVCVPL